MTSSTINYNPHFSGLKIDKRIPAPIERAIRQNNAVIYGAKKLNLKFELMPYNPNSKNGLIVCVISSIKKTILDYINPFKSMFDCHEIHFGGTKPNYSSVLRNLKLISKQTDFFEKQHLHPTPDAEILDFELLMALICEHKYLH